MTLWDNKKTKINFDEINKTHFGSIKFTTKDRVEFPYLDDISKKFKEVIVEYCEEYNIPLIAVRISINVVNQELPILTTLYTHCDFLENSKKVKD